MKNRSKPISLVLALLLLSTDQARAESKSIDVIMDIDLGFFLTRPKIPWGGDPFEKTPGYAAVTPRTAEQFVLSGIFYSKDDPIAVINGTSLHEGEFAGDRKIAEIGENFVILKKQNSEIELTLPPAEEFEEEEEE